MANTDTTRTAGQRRLGALRLAIGLAQGLALYALHASVTAKAWPSTDPVAIATLGAVAFYVPFVWLAGLGLLRPKTLVGWLVVASGLAASLGAYAAWREADVEPKAFAAGPMAAATFLALGASLFIGHHLIAPADETRRPFAPYRLYFDTAWKHAVQLALSGAFLGAFWIVLELGAALFALIGLKGLQTAINKDWFWMPVSGLVFAGGVHLSDVRVWMTKGLRTLGLTLLAWLMPLMGLIAAAFLVALPFTGLQALWKVGHATALLLFASAALIVLLNAAYQDGSDETRPPRFLQWAGRVTAVVLLPMAALASLGLFMRIGEHGFTPDRIVALGCLVAAIVYAVGYALAALRKGPWLKGLERTNIVAAVVDLAIILAIFTPIADPARISTEDQVGRLESGKVAPDKFDYAFLRFKAGRWGRDELKRLAHAHGDARALDIAKRAQGALAEQNEWEARTSPGSPAEHIVMHPAGTAVPKDLVEQVAAGSKDVGRLAACTTDYPCDGYVVDLGPNDREDLIVANIGGSEVYRRGSNGRWSNIATVRPNGCDIPGLLKKGPIRAAQPELPSLEAAGRRLDLIPHDGCETGAQGR